MQQTNLQLEALIKLVVEFAAFLVFDFSVSSSPSMISLIFWSRVSVKITKVSCQDI